MLFCSLSPEFIYIEDTGKSIRPRMNVHKIDIRHHNNSHMDKDFNLSGHSATHFQVSVLKRIDSSRRQRLIEEQNVLFEFSCIREVANKE